MSNQTDHTIVRLRVPPELKQKIEESAEKNNRSQSAEMVARLEGSFEPRIENQDQTQMMQAAMIQIIVAATKAFGKKGLEWPDIQANLVEATEDLIKNINNKKAP